MQPLPAPTRERWQPLRLGLVELFHYDCEEFHFRDGHLLLRGNNGTGKSKVLSLTLPFLLDANLSPSRVEPDGDRSKRMDWNLLMHRHERRIGYAWIEFGRIDADGRTRILTLGCGLSAVAGRARVDAWHFITTQRVGDDLHLISRERNTLTRERLDEALGAHGQIYATARDYRRAVDEHLFRLGDTRYAALIDTLIQLRQPQLSRKPDENNLSAALGNALPELPRQVLEDVAEAMNQLDEYRDELEQIERVRDAVAQFGARYRLYAGIQARRQSREVRQAQTTWDNASRAVADTRVACETQQVHVAESFERHAALLERWRLDRAALEELQRDPRMQDAHRLRDLERNAAERLREADIAAARASDAQVQAEREQGETRRRAAQADSSARRAQAAVQQAQGDAAAAGIGDAHGAAVAPVIAADAPVPDTLRDAFKRAAERRAEQIAQLRRRLRARDAAAQQRDLAMQAREAAQDAAQMAQDALAAADDNVQGCAQQWRAAAHRHLQNLRILQLSDLDTLHATLAEWTQTAAGENPLRDALGTAARSAMQAIASARGDIARRRGEHVVRDAALQAEQQALELGEDRHPPAPRTRDAEARAGRPGAPLWQWLDFRDGVQATVRAGVEAALEATGLLDAWVTPDGALLHPDTLDQWLLPRAPRADSLRRVLCVADGAPAHIDALLAGIAFGDDDRRDAESWVSARGHYRIGGLRGTWRKPVAEYIGHAARIAARQQRLQAIAIERATLHALRSACDDEDQALDQRQRMLDRELADAPPDDALREAHAQHTVAARQLRAALEHVARLDARLQQVEQGWRDAQRALDDDATDLQLPSDADALDAIETALAAYRTSAQTLLHALLERARDRSELHDQLPREVRALAQAQARAAEQAERRASADDTVAARDALRARAGADIAALERQLAEHQRAVEHGEREADAARDAHAAAVTQHALAQQAQDIAAAAFEQRSAARLQAVEHLRDFAATGLLAQALPELTLPADEGWSTDPALHLARRIEQSLAGIDASDEDWRKAQDAISREFTSLGQALSALGQQAQMKQHDYGLLVEIVYRNQPRRPDHLERELGDEAAQRRAILSASEREVLENHLQQEVAASLQRHLQDAERRILRINAELKRHPTSTGVYFRLDWEPLPEGADGAPAGLAAARERLLKRSADVWSAQERREVGEFLQTRIALERNSQDQGTLLEHLVRALDYRRWHRFRVRRWHDGAWRPLSGPASSGERALGLTVPLFAAASSHYASGDFPHAPRLVLLDEAFAGIDDEARAHCMALIREFDLDFVMTSEREWGCYATLPGVAISQIVRRDGIDAIFVSRWTWDGVARRAEPDPTRRGHDPVSA